MLEYKKKVLLSEVEYTWLKKEIHYGSKTIVQTNYYYDTDTLEMYSCGITCRISEMNGFFSVEIKEHHKDWGDCSIVNCHSISKRFDESFFLNMKLKKQGMLITKRMIIEHDNIKLMLDKNTYLGFTDYELQIEYTPLYESQATDELKRIAKKLKNRGIIDSLKAFAERTGKHNNKYSRLSFRNLIFKTT